MPTISVVIPTRNRLHFLQEAIASVLAQDFENWEMIVVDDASEDGTWEWLSSLQVPKITTLRMPRHGERSATRNLGLQHARGEFVIFLDDDDLLSPGALGYLCSAMRQNPDSVAAVGARVQFDQQGHSRRSPHPHWRFTKCVWSDVYFGWAPVCGQTLFRKSRVLEVGGWNSSLSIAEDHELWMRLSLKRTAILLPRVVLKARLHEGQTSLANFRIRQFDRIKVNLLTQADPGSQRQGRMLLEAYRRFRVGQTAFRVRRYKTSLACFAAAARRAPGQLWSPLTGSDLGLGLMKSVACGLLPVRVALSVRRIRHKWRSLRKRNPGALDRKQTGPPAEKMPAATSTLC